MAVQDIGRSVNEFASEINASIKKASFADLAKFYEIIGLITMVVSAIFAISSLPNSLFLTSLAAILFVVGHELRTMGSNANDDSFLTSVKLAIAALSPEAFHTALTKQTWLPSFLVKETTWLSAPLYSSYKESL